LEQYVTLILFAAAAGALLSTAHFVFQEQEIGPPWTYVIGVGWIQATVIAWMLYTKQDGFSVLGICIITAAIGGAILLCYLIDKAKQADRARSYVTSERLDRD
jgi:hypothetical protein